MASTKVIVLFHVRSTNWGELGSIRAVSLTPNPCGKASNVLKVINGNLTQSELDGRRGGGGRKLAYCVKGLYYPFEDYSIQLMEWLELSKQLGVSKVFIYYLQLTERYSTA